MKTTLKRFKHATNERQVEENFKELGFSSEQVIKNWGSAKNFIGNWFPSKIDDIEIDEDDVKKEGYKRLNYIEGIILIGKDNYIMWLNVPGYSKGGYVYVSSAIYNGYENLREKRQKEMSISM